MRCRTCGHDNRESAAFCENCGAKLSPVCPQCGTEVRPVARFCDACGHRLGEAPPPRSMTGHPPATATPPRQLAEKILREQATMEGERRTVTLLSVDAVDSTPLAERLSEEAFYRLIQGCLARLLAVVHRYEGTAQLRGDGFLALFGAPIAHEDAARRAVAAALEMQQALAAAAAAGPHGAATLSFRMGVNTGPVIVGTIGHDLSVEYTAIGDTANLAARMQQLALPGAVSLSEATYRAVQDYVECAPLGALAVKGKAEPVVAYQAVREKGVRGRLEAATARGLTSHTGREHELHVLQGYGEQARRGQGHVVFISGEAGIGKSRLLLEFRRTLQTEEMTWLEGHCISYGQSISYLPIVDLLKAVFGVEEGDVEPAIVGRVDQATAGWEAAARATAPYLKYLLSVDPGDPVVLAMDAVQRRAGIFDGLRALLVEESRRCPLVVVLEDLHWADEKSGEALAALVDLIATLSVLLILTHRIGYAPTLGDRTYYTRLALGQLPPRESIALAEAVLGVAELPPALQRLIGQKAEGNPLYIEEVLRALLETGNLRQNDGAYELTRPLEQIHVPATIQEIILSRIDHLEQQAREALQLAAVIGREFTQRLLGRIADPQVSLEGALGELRALELIIAKAYFPELAYMFKHALTQDVAYSTLLLERRMALHRIVAVAVEELYVDRLPEHYETLAHHYTEGEVWEKALEYAIKAGDKAAAAFANTDALRYYDQALQVCERLGDAPSQTQVGIYAAKAAVCVTLSRWKSVVDNYSLLRSVARTTGDRRAEGMALAGIAMGCCWSHEFASAETTSHEAIAMAAELNDDTIRGLALFVLGVLDILRGQLSSGYERVAEAVGLCRHTGQAAQEIYGAYLLSLCLAWQGRYDEARGMSAEVMAAGQLYHVTTPLLGATWSHGLALASHGDYSAAICVMHATITLAERMGNMLYQARAWNSLGWILGEIWDWEQALTCNRKGLEIARTIGDPEITVNTQINLADCAAATGRAEQARRDLEALYGALPGLHEWMKWRYSQHLTHSLGELVLAEGDMERALDLASECLALAEPTESRKNIVKGLRLRGQTLLAQGDLAGAEAEITRALEVAYEIANPPQLWKTLAALGDLRQAQGRLEEATRAYHEARVVIEGVADGLSDEDLRQTFLSSEHVCSIRVLTGQKAGA